MRAIGPLLALLFLPGLAHAGAWTSERGDGLAILRLTHDRAETRFDAAGRKRLGDAFAKDEVQLYAEYGATDWLTLIAAPTGQRLRDGEVQATGLAFADLGGRARLYHGRHGVVSVQALVILPGTLDGGESAVVASGATEAELRLLHGRSFTLFGRHAFVDVSGAYRKRGGGFADEWRADATFGVDVMKRTKLLAQTFSTFGGARFMLHKLQTSVVYAVTPRIGLEAGASQAVVGRDVVAERAFFTGIWYRF